MINFIPNDPLSLADSPLRQQQERPERPANRAGFDFAMPLPTADLYPLGTPEFLLWQSREAALAALEAWEAVDGPFSAWSSETPNPRVLLLSANQGDNLNAIYERKNGITFFEHTSNGKTTFSAASTDVVAHEVGHGILDAIRPDFWNSGLPEISAFHEAFGDCIALLTALSDHDARRRLLQLSPDLGSANFVESLFDDLAEGIRKDPQFGPGHPASAPRRALNTLQWQLSLTLAPSGKPQALTSESHSLGRVFCGCFYDLIRLIFAAAPHQDETSLLNASQVSARLLIEAARRAPEEIRYFQAAGRVMVLADEVLHGSANRAMIGQAFAAHGIALGTNAMLAPRSVLAGAAPRLAIRGLESNILTRETVKDLRKRLAIPAAKKLGISIVKLGGQKVARVSHITEISLRQLGKDFKDIVVRVPQQVMVGKAERSAALLSSLPDLTSVTDEVNAFVATLLKHDQLHMPGKSSAAKMTASTPNLKKLPPMNSHTIVSKEGRRVLRRVRFSCTHCTGLR